MPSHGQGLSLIWFPKADSEVNMDDLFSEVTGMEPDSVVKNRTPSAEKPYLALSDRIIGETKIALQQQVGRLELSIAPKDTGSSVGVPLIELEVAIQYARDCLARVKNLPTAHRIACNLRKNTPAKSQEEAGQLFCDFVGIKLKAEQVSDHLFQMNRRSVLAGFPCNRLVNVSVAEHRLLQVDSATGQAKQAGQPQFALCAVYDFNTVPSGNHDLDSSSQKAIFEEMFLSLKSAIDVPNISFLETQS